MKKLLVSACLLGQPIRYDGDDNGDKVTHLTEWLERWRLEGRLVAVCPETLGGLSTPRPPAESVGGDGHGVLDSSARVITYEGTDVTTAFVEGAQKTLNTALTTGATGALLAARSPSCGSGEIYNGSFTRTVMEGDGVTVALLKQNGIRCFTPAEAEMLIQWMTDIQT